MVSSKQFSERIECGQIDLKQNDWLIQYTDGINEAQNADSEEFGMDRFIESLKVNSNETPDVMIKNTISVHNDFTGDQPQFDDITMIAVHRKSD